MWIVFEGPEATGKSTQATLLRDELMKRGKEVLLTKEPGSPHDPLCVKIRELLLNPEYDITQDAAVFLFLADRAQHMRKVVEPALEEGKIVISDRSSLSTFFYYLAESIGFDEDYMMINHNMLFEALAMAQDYRKADLCLVARANHDWAKDNMVSRGGLDRIEQKGEALHKNIHKYFETVVTEDDLHEEVFFPKVICDLPALPQHTIEEVAAFALEKTLSFLQ